MAGDAVGRLGGREMTGDAVRQIGRGLQPLLVAVDDHDGALVMWR